MMMMRCGCGSAKPCDRIEKRRGRTVGLALDVEADMFGDAKVNS
jgi:hypothetical protein